MAFQYSVGQVVGSNTVIAQPTGLGQYPNSYLLQRQNGSQFYDTLAGESEAIAFGNAPASSIDPLLNFQARSIMFPRPPATIYPREVGTGGATQNSSSSNPYGGTVVQSHLTPVGAGFSDLSLVFANYTNSGSGETVANLSTVTITASIEDASGNPYPVFFNGQGTTTIAPGGQINSDPVGLFIPGNTAYKVRYWWSVPASGYYPAANDNPTGYDTSNVAVQTGGAGSDETLGSYSATSGGYQVQYCVNVLGVPFAGSSNLPVVAIVGDSIAKGYFGNNNYDSYIVLALRAANITFHTFACPGEKASIIATPLLFSKRLARAAGCTHAIIEYGINDINAGNNAAMVKANLLSLMKNLYALGLQLFACTILPQPQPTIGAYTNINQETGPNANDSVRQAINAWYRAPASAGAGNSARFDAAAQGTPLTAVFDAASYIETDTTNATPGGPSNPNLGGLFFAAATSLYTYGHPTTPGHQMIAPSINTALITVSS